MHYFHNVKIDHEARLRLSEMNEEEQKKQVEQVVRQYTSKALLLLTFIYCSLCFPLFSFFHHYCCYYAALEARLNASDLEGQSKKLEQLRKENRGNTTNKSNINDQKTQFPSHPFMIYS